MTQTTAGKRLERAARAAQGRAESRAEEASRERRSLIASWKLRGRVPEHMATAPEEEIDGQIALMAEEVLYQYERQHGPVRALLPTPDLAAEEWGARTDAEVAGYCKGILQDGVTPEWKRPRGWLMAGQQESEPGQNAEERQ